MSKNARLQIAANTKARLATRRSFPTILDAKYQSPPYHCRKPYWQLIEEVVHSREMCVLLPIDLDNGNGFLDSRFAYLSLLFVASEAGFRLAKELIDIDIISIVSQRVLLALGSHSFETFFIVFLDLLYAVRTRQFLQ